MDHSDDDRPSAYQPVRGPRRPKITPLLATLALVVVIAAVFGFVTWLRYNT